MSDHLDAYATALFEVARAEGRLDEVEDELFRVGRAIQGSDELKETLSDQRVPLEKRQAIVEDLLGSKASGTTTSLVSFVVGSGRSRDLPKIIERLVARAAAEKGKAVAEVRSAIPLDGDQQARLAAALSKATGKSVAVKVVIDPSIMGGLVAQIGDKIIDGSVKTRLEQLKGRL